MVRLEVADLVDKALPAPHPCQVLGLGELCNALEHVWGGFQGVLGKCEPEVINFFTAKTEFLLVEGDTVTGPVGEVLADHVKLCFDAVGRAAPFPLLAFLSLAHIECRAGVVALDEPFELILACS